MSAIWNALDNREKALLLWIVVLVAVGLMTRTGRDFARSMLSIARGALSAILVVYALYVAAVVSLLAWAGLWMTAVASATAFWFAGALSAEARDARAPRAHLARRRLRRVGDHRQRAARRRRRARPGEEPRERCDGAAPAGAGA
jgi:hypothetical protein